MNINEPHVIHCRMLIQGGPERCLDPSAILGAAMSFPKCATFSTLGIFGTVIIVHFTASDVA